MSSKIRQTMLRLVRHSVKLFNFTSPTLVRLQRSVSPYTGVLFLHTTKMSTKELIIDDQVLMDPQRHLDFETFVKQKNEGSELIVIDVRQPKELANTGVIPGSINIPLSEIENALTGISDEDFLCKYGQPKPAKNTNLIFSCQAGRRSFAALKIALQHGFMNSAHYKGGWSDWETHIKSTSKT